MTRALLLKVSSVISFIFAAGHSLGGLQKWSPMGSNDVLTTMSSVHFRTYGVSRSYLDFFMGFGWSLSIGMLVQATILWQMAKLTTDYPAAVRPMIAVFVIATIASMAVNWFFLFPVPVLFSLVLLCPLIAAYMVRR